MPNWTRKSSPRLAAPLSFGRRGAGGEVVARARQLRKKQTPAEQMLWACLRDRRLGGLKFRRQHPIDKFIADFYCHEARLIVEVDGAVHRENDQAERDALRTEVLRRFGLSVVRVTNTEVETALEKVLSAIAGAAQAGK
ncbi:MAG TPA: endonuclease domain-containing protein [Candidatus Deferrimicrobium sp.]|nr:endonuclease domain-containing protein [Candidatus Deferrimicrobium sp.]